MRPTLCSPITLETLLRLAEDPRWSCSQKVDGTRLLAVVEQGKVTGYSRKGEKTIVPSVIAKALSGRLPEGRFVLDGELLGNEYVVFDLIEAGDNDGYLIGSRCPYNHRLLALQNLALLTKWDKPLLLLPVAQTTVEKLTLIKRVEESRCEGVVARLNAGTYQEGKRSKDVVKWKRRRSIDCVLNEGTQGKANFTLVLFDNGNEVEVGAISSLTGDGPRLKVGDVVTVDYAGASESGQLIQPVTPMKRTDKDPVECGIDQLVFVNKEVLL